MAERDEERKLEELLDSMLAAYSAAEPRPGLETRIVANLRTQGSQSDGRSWGRFWLWAGAGVAAAVAALVFAVLHRPAERPIPTPAEIVRSTPKPAPDTSSPAKPLQESSKAVRHALHKPAVVQVADMRPDAFPTPTPLSEQERLLLRYLAGTPKEEIVAQSHVDEPPQDSLPENQTALPGPAINNSHLSNTR
jgi:hypothetical protein